ncbi:hypothetical protein TEA_026688 [Camellia sinensis var. sinensis]|uniref:SHSP domain-containing protein n=1 Tax=Camellia sinensis var. sinensis TaxID=542762 RepID=A0A4S4E3Z5_CAMSN|nr:hypothetical protein TEA_026688 [Camellia sinensis var. sinensis]
MKVKVNEDGAWIVASGERPVQETVMVAKEVYKKEIKMRGFRKAFKIPDGTILDKIKAGFDEEELVLTISMPKLVKGIHGIRIEEVKEEEAARGSFKSLQITANRVDERETLQQEEYREPERQNTTQDVIEPKERERKRKRRTSVTNQLKQALHLRKGPSNVFLSWQQDQPFLCLL